MTSSIALSGLMKNPGLNIKSANLQRKLASAKRSYAIALAGFRIPMLPGVGIATKTNAVIDLNTKNKGNKKYPSYLEITDKGVPLCPSGCSA